MASVRLAELTHVCLFGSPQISTQLVHELCDREIPVAYFSAGGYFRGITDRAAEQERRAAAGGSTAAADDPAFCLTLAKAWVAGKIENQRTMLRRNHAGGAPAIALEDLRLAGLSVRKAASLAKPSGNRGKRRQGVLRVLQRDVASAGRRRAARG